MDVIKKLIVLNWIFIVVAVAGLVFDLGSKSIVFSALDAEIGTLQFENTKTGKIEDVVAVVNGDTANTAIIKGFFEFHCTMNPGGMWGVLAKYTSLLIGFSIACIGMIVFMVTRLDPTQKFMRISLGLILAGAFGNLYDRLLFDGVRDFIVFHLPFNYTWPAFNVADIWIVAGVAVIFILEFFFAPKKKEEDEKGKTESKTTTTA